MTVPIERFGEVATWLAVNRGGPHHLRPRLDRRSIVADHSRNVVWFGPSEALNLTIFD